jgi:DNA-binding NarL/FixJ family response regulator
VKLPQTTISGDKPYRVAVIGDTCVSEAGLTAIVGRDRRYHICGGAHGLLDVDELIRCCRPDILLIEPFLEDRDGILLIKQLAKNYPRMRILVVSRQSERVYAERALHCGAVGYWMKNGSPEELMHAIDIVASGDIYASPAIVALAIKRFARRSDMPSGLDSLSDRELTVFSSIATGRGTGKIAAELGVSRKTIETHCEHIKHKLGYSNAEELRRGAEELLGDKAVGEKRP